MTGSNMREKVTHDFIDKSQFSKEIETLANVSKCNRVKFQLPQTIEIVKQMKFFQDSFSVMTDDDAWLIAKRLKYKFIPKGQPIRRALEK